MRQAIGLLVLSAGTFVLTPSFVHAGDEPTAQAVIDRALDAGGGAARIGEYKAVLVKANLKSGDKNVRMEGVFAGPSLFRVEFDVKDQEKVVCIGGGDTYWLKEGNEPFKEFKVGSDDGSLDSLVRLLHGVSLPDQLLALKKKEYTLSIAGDQAVSGVQAIAMRVSHPQYSETMIYFDKETGLPVKVQFDLPQPKEGLGRLLAKPGDELVELFFDNYQQVNDVKHFMTLKIRKGDEKIVAEISELKLLKKVDSRMFK